MKKPQAYWVNPLFWTCTRHIPTHLTYMANVTHCPSCKASRPEMDVKAPVIPSAHPLPPLEEFSVYESHSSPEPVETDPAPEVNPTPEVPIVIAQEAEVQTPKAPMKLVRVMPKRVSDGQPLPPCAWPRCRKRSRENSPYCSKICSDRCGRVRRKTNPNPSDARLQNAVLDRMTQWSSRGASAT